MRILLVVALIITLLTCASCMPGPRSRWNEAKPAGFFAGLWHGIISFFSLILSLFTRVTMYECNNTGFLYNLGYYIGIAGVFGGGTKIVFKKR
ncbi:hypothetical protein JW905_18270 [bacterium]|nr:hypothetical protein [candidate division CSSED10-310 bacterium]